MFQSKSITKYMNNNNFKRMKYFFITVQVITFLDFGFIECKFYKKLFWKLLTFMSFLFFGVMALVYIFVAQNTYFQIWSVKSLLECLFYVIILILTPKDKTFCSYVIALEYFDKEIGVSSSRYKILPKIIFYFALGTIFDLFFLVLLFFSSEADIITIRYAYILFNVPRRTASFPVMVFFFVFYSVFRRLRKLKLYIVKRRVSIFRARQYYKSLIDSTENALTYFRYIVSEIASLIYKNSLIY